MAERSPEVRPPLPPFRRVSVSSPPLSPLPSPHLSVFRCSVSGKGILSGHADGSIVRFFFDDEGSGESQVSKILLQ